MIKHALLLIYRGLKKSKTVFLINLVGLSTGLAAALLILLWINDERSVDRFHEHDANLYQVMVNRVQENHVNTEEGASGVLGETLKREFPEVEAAATISPESWFQKFNISYKENTIGAKGILPAGIFSPSFHSGCYQETKTRCCAIKQVSYYLKRLPANCLKPLKTR